MTINSAYRCPKHNAVVSATGESGPHTKSSYDVAVSGVSALKLITIAHDEGFSGIGVSQKGKHTDRFIHIDDLLNEVGQPRPWIWSY